MPVRVRKPAMAGVAAGLLLNAGLASGSLLYQDSFEPGDPVDYVAVTNSITHGLPDLVGPQGAMTSSSARFSTVGNQPSFFYDQAAYVIPADVRVIAVDFDLVFTEFVGPSSLKFDVSLDAPNINMLMFRPDGLVRGPGPVTRSFGNDTVIHVSILFDEIARRWSSSINGVPFSNFAIFAPNELDLRSVRFVLGFQNGSNGPALRPAVYLDNLVIAAVPLPGGFVLLTSALAGLVVRAGSRGRLSGTAGRAPAS